MKNIKKYKEYNKEFIEFRVVKFKNIYTILSIHEKTPDIYTGLYTHMYDGTKIKPFKYLDVFGKDYIKYDNHNSSFMKNKYYDDIVANATDEITVYVTDDIKDALSNMVTLFDMNLYNL